MSETNGTGVLYTEHSRRVAMTPAASLWSYETRSRGHNRRVVELNVDGSREYWLEWSDPLLNTILPGTGVSLVVNLGEPWAAGRSLEGSALLPRVCVIGPVTHPRILRVGRRVHAIGAVLHAAQTSTILGVPASEVIDQIVPLEELWTPADVETLFASLSCLETQRGISVLKEELVARMSGPNSDEPVGRTAPRFVTLHGGRVSIDAMATSHGVSRKQFARRFFAAVGLPPKLFARITRFQALVKVLLSTDVSQWASVAPAVGFYDQAHMINEFRTFAGSSPTVFFQPHGGHIAPGHIQLRGRPQDWCIVRRLIDDRDRSNLRNPVRGWATTNARVQPPTGVAPHPSALAEG